jgi:hypothetical protein
VQLDDRVLCRIYKKNSGVPALADYDHLLDHDEHSSGGGFVYTPMRTCCSVNATTHDAPGAGAPDDGYSHRSSLKTGRHPKYYMGLKGQPVEVGHMFWSSSCPPQNKWKGCCLFGLPGPLFSSLSINMGIRVW